MQPERIVRRQWRGASLRFAAPLIGLFLLLAIWALGGWMLTQSPEGEAFAGFAPRPALACLARMIADGSLWQAFLPSIRRIGFGLAFAILVGAPVGVLVGHSPLFRQITHVPFQLLRMISPLAWMPVAILASPTWEGAIVFLIAAAAVWPIIFATANGLQKLNPTGSNLQRTLVPDRGIC